VLVSSASPYHLLNDVLLVYGYLKGLICDLVSLVGDAGRLEVGGTAHVDCTNDYTARSEEGTEKGDSTSSGVECISQQTGEASPRGMLGRFARLR
jgi:hypothetical protein